MCLLSREKKTWCVGRFCLLAYLPVAPSGLVTGDAVLIPLLRRSHDICSLMLVLVPSGLLYMFASCVFLDLKF